MTQPVAYDRHYSFTDFQTANPSTPLPANQVEIELNAIKATIDALRANMAITQRDDTTLAYGSVGISQMAADVAVGFNPPTTWVTATGYTASPRSTVFNGSKIYTCNISHTSGTFATDLAALKWTLIFDLTTVPVTSAALISVAPSGLLTTNVQTSLEALDAGKAATSHTHTAAQISNATTAGRAMITAADVAAQQALLGLGALAYLSSVTITDLPSSIAFSGDITPAALAANTNDWAPAGLSTASTIRMSANSAINITGLTGGADGRVIVLHNVGTNAVTLTSNDTASSAANRFTFPRPQNLRPGMTLVLQYDSTASLWRAIASDDRLPVAAGFKNLQCGNVAGVNGFTAPATPNKQYKILADAITLEDANGESYRAMNVSLAAVDGSTTGANGMDASTFGNSTWYALFVIYNPTTNTVAGLWSTSATTPTMPSGYTFKARVGWGRTDGSANLLRVLQQGREAQYVLSTTAVQIIASGVTGTYSTTSPTLSAASIASIVPTTASHIHGIAMGSWKNGASSNVLVAPSTGWGGTNNGPLGSAGQLWPIWANSALGAWFSQSFRFLLEGTTIGIALDAAGGAVIGMGWTDNI